MREGQGAQGPLRLMYVAPAYPVLSETFVRREVEALRAAGDHAAVVGLRRVPEASRPQSSPRGEKSRDFGASAGETLTPPSKRDAAGASVLYRCASVAAALNEAARHPFRAVNTFATALRDAIAPGEPMGLKERVKVVPQAVAALGLARMARNEGIGHLHAHFAHAPTTVVMYAARQLGGTFSFTGHANDIFQRRCLLKRKLERAAFVSCISHWHRAFYEELAPGSAAKGVVVRCGVPLSDVRPKIAGDGKSLRLLTVARLVAKKGIDVLLRAAAELPEARVTVAGDGPEREALEALARELGLAERVKFLGAVASEAVPDLLAAADVFVLPCRPDSAGDKDGIPVVLMEAMAAAVPVVSGDLPAIRELVEDGVSGRLIRPGNVADLVDTLSQLRDEPTRRGMLAAGGQLRVQTEFAQPLNIQRLRNAFAERTVQCGEAWPPQLSPRPSNQPDSTGVMPSSALAGMKPSIADEPSIASSRSPALQP